MSTHPSIEPKSFKPAIQDVVADTLFIPLYMRAKLSQRNKNRIINDPSAIKLVEQIDYDFEKYDQADMSLIGCGVRADYFDQFTITHIRQSLNRNRPLTIVSLGCGLDDRYQRICDQIGADVITSEYLRFYEIDLPEVIELRATLLPEAKNQTYIAGSILEDDWLTQLIDHLQSSPAPTSLPTDFVVLIEGVLMYFEEAEVEAFFSNLAQSLTTPTRANLVTQSEPSSNFRIGEIRVMFDAVTSLGVKMSDKHDSLSQSNATFKWGMDDKDILTTWDHRYQLKQLTYIMDIKPKLWPIKAHLARLIPPIHHISRILTYSLQ